LPQSDVALKWLQAMTSVLPNLAASASPAKEHHQKNFSIIDL